MAKLSADKQSVTVERGDTLTQIAVDYAGGYSKYKQLAAINNISNPNRIYIGQVIRLVKSSGSGSTAKKNANSNAPTINQFGIQSDTDNTLFATWTWDKSNTASYKVVWTYDTGDGVWFDGATSTITVDKDNPSLARQSTYSIPNNAERVQFKVKPISETYKKNNVDTNYWDASWSEVKTWTVTTPLGVPDTPSVEIKEFVLTASLNNIDIEGATHIFFQVVKNNSANASSVKADIKTSSASHSFKVFAGNQYKVRCRAYNSKNNTYSEWSKYSDNKDTIPSPPETIELEARSEDSVTVSWPAVPNVTITGYTVEYTTEKIYFDSAPNEVKSATVGEDTTTAIITGMTTGEEYFFRVKSTNREGDSDWSVIKSIVIGKAPAAPTTWSSTTTAIVGNPVTLYWVHNAEDGSSQTFADLRIYIGDELIKTYTIENTKDEDEKDKTSQFVFDTSSYTEGTSFRWHVRTAGVTKEYGEWSTLRHIDIYAQPLLEMGMTEWDGQPTDVLHSYPFFISALASPKTQTPIGYHLTIKSNEIYDTIDNLGNSRTVNKDEVVYSKHFDTNQALLVELGPGNVELANNIEYTVSCTVSMDSGLTAESSFVFLVTWRDDAQYIPNAEIGIDEDTMSANIRPYCEDSRIVYYQVNLESGLYKKTETELPSVWGEVVRRAVTTTGELVYYGTTEDGEDVYYCIVEEKTPVTTVHLSVYRREFDGSFTELATGLPSSKTTTIIDPHPALDYARYRIVATNPLNGAVGYYDLPSYPVGGKAVIIQWDEDWSSFETSEETAMEQPPWSGSMLKLLYNIDVSNSHSPDISLIEYAGRSHPVSYYGTQLGTSATWSLEIPKDDKETLYALRRLARWMGDVYVREPSGSGYWASITVSFSQKHCEVTIPVTLNISQVEGGI